MSQFVSVEVQARVATILLSRPPVNALSLQMQREIMQAAQEVGARDDVGAVVLYGGPKHFVAGADIKEMLAMSYQDMARASVGLQDAFTSVARIPQPTIAAVTGYALGGGCELALCCDLRIIGSGARLGQPEILLGVIPGAGGTQRLPRLVGTSRAKELILTGRHVDAQEALAIGLANRVVPDEDVYATAHDLAARLARGPALAMKAAKQVIDRGVESDLVTGLEMERIAFAALFATQDRAIGMSSFVEHGPGKAEFTGS
jgi:enoyl-CoA hydratase/carnithine racemase